MLIYPALAKLGREFLRLLSMVVRYFLSESAKIWSRKWI